MLLFNWPLWKLYLIILMSFALFFYLTATLFYLFSPRNSYAVSGFRQFWKEIFYVTLNLAIFSLATLITYVLWLNGYTLIYPDIGEHGIAYYLLTVLATVLIHSTYFYWSHRLLHSSSLLFRYHRLHHSSHMTSPLGAFYFHPVEGLIVSGIVPVIAFLIPIHWTVIPVFIGIMTTINIYGHSGLEFFHKNIYNSWPGKWFSSSTHHEQHHDHGIGNYGIYFCFWDNWMSTERKDFTQKFKTITSKRIGFNTPHFRRKLPFISIFMLIIFLNMTISCSYYKSNIIRPPTKETIDQLKYSGDFIVIHQGSSIRDTPAWYLANIEINNKEAVITATLLKEWYLEGLYSRGNKYRPKEQPTLVNEIHIYVNKINAKYGAVEIKFSELVSVEIMDKDKVLTTLSGASPALLFVAINIIAALSSCPYIYSNSSDETAFEGEIYGGAIYKSLERHDYLKLKNIEPANGQYTIQIANKLHEKQFINLMEIVQVEHSLDVEVYSDQYGEFYTIKDPKPPSTAFSSNRVDLLPLIVESDHKYFQFDEITGDQAVNQVIMTFSKPAVAQSAKLLLNVKNSIFGDYVYGEFTKYFGNYYSDWIEEQGNLPPDDHIQWQKDQKVMLEVQMQTDKGWETIDYLYVVGPFGAKDLVLPLDLSSHKGDELNIRLTSGFMFWEVDQAAIDFSDNKPMQVKKLTPVKVRSNKSVNQLSLVLEDDQKYLHQFEIGDLTSMEFSASPLNSDSQRSLFLHSKGYYEHQRDYTNYPDIIALYSFKKPGKLSSFSVVKYNELLMLADIGIINVRNNVDEDGEQ